MPWRPKPARLLSRVPDVRGGMGSPSGGGKVEPPALAVKLIAGCR